MSKLFRIGAKGALLDEYEKAILELQEVIEDVSDKELTTIIDTQTTDENCKSIQTILSHVVNAGYGYAYRISKLKGNESSRPKISGYLTRREYFHDLTVVFKYTENVFQDLSESELEQYDNSQKIKTEWGQIYDIEQMMEHAIVHILRHRRQIEKFKIIIREERNEPS